METHPLRHQCANVAATPRRKRGHVLHCLRLRNVWTCKCWNLYQFMLFPWLMIFLFQTGNVTLYSAVIQYVIFLVTTGIMLPFIDRIGRRQLLLVGAVLCCILQFAIAGIMASYGHYVTNIDGNYNLRWTLPSGSSASTGVIACSYIFVGIYGLTWAPTGWM